MTRDDLIAWLKVRRLPKAALAHRLGVTRMTVYRWCSGATPLPIDLADRLPRMPARPPHTFKARVWSEKHGRYMRRIIRDYRSQPS